MKAHETNKESYNFLNFEALLRRYIAHPEDKGISNKIERVISSVIAFQKGDFQTNEYISPSEAYNLFFSSFDVTDSKLELENIKTKISENSNDEDLIRTLNRILRTIENRNQSNGNVENFFIAWG